MERVKALRYLPWATRVGLGILAFGSVAVEKASAQIPELPKLSPSVQTDVVINHSSLSEEFTIVLPEPNTDGGGPGCVLPTPPQGVEFKLGFKALADQASCIVGAPLENEHWGANGDSLQITSNGLMVWRKADNWTAFTDGFRTLVNGPSGIQTRPNDQRFEWEAQKSPEELFQDKVNADKQAYPGVYAHYVSVDGYMVKAPEGVSLKTVENVAIRIAWNLRDRPDLVKTLSDKARYIIFPSNMSVIQLPEFADLAGATSQGGFPVDKNTVAITRPGNPTISAIREDYAVKNSIRTDRELAIVIKLTCMNKSERSAVSALYLEYKNNKPGVFANPNIPLNLAMVSEEEFWGSVSAILFGSLTQNPANAIAMSNGIATTEQLREKAPDVYNFIMSFYHPNFVNTGK